MGGKISQIKDKKFWGTGEKKHRREESETTQKEGGNCGLLQKRGGGLSGVNTGGEKGSI